MKSFNGLLILSLFFSAQSVFATEGSSSRGGGDIQCDNLIQNLLYQDPAGNLRAWLQSGGPEAGKLNLSSTLNPSTGKPYTNADYETGMITLINTFAQSPDVNCVRPGDKGFPVDVGDTSKICASVVDQKGVHMTCDRNLFMALTADQQIEQTHHEIAIHIPGLESDNGSISTYAISTQLSNSIQTVPERRLVVGPMATLDLSPFEGKNYHSNSDSSEYSGYPGMPAYGCLRHFEVSGSEIYVSLSSYNGYCNPQKSEQVRQYECKNVNGATKCFNSTFYSTSEVSDIGNYMGGYPQNWNTLPTCGQETSYSTATVYFESDEVLSLLNENVMITENTEKYVAVITTQDAQGNLQSCKSETWQNIYFGRFNVGLGVRKVTQTQFSVVE